MQYMGTEYVFLLNMQKHLKNAYPEVTSNHVKKLFLPHAGSEMPLLKKFLNCMFSETHPLQLSPSVAKILKSMRLRWEM